MPDIYVTYDIIRWWARTCYRCSPCGGCSGGLFVKEARISVLAASLEAWGL